MLFMKNKVLSAISAVYCDCIPWWPAQLRFHLLSTKDT